MKKALTEPMQHDEVSLHEDQVSLIEGGRPASEGDLVKVVAREGDLGLSLIHISEPTRPY